MVTDNKAHPIQATTSTQLLGLLILLQAAYQEGGFVLLLMQQDVPHLTEPLLLLLLFLVLCSSTAAPPSPAVVAASPLSLPGKVAIERGVIFWHNGVIRSFSSLRGHSMPTVRLTKLTSFLGSKRPQQMFWLDAFGISEH